eukprot:3261664-Pleurochrysis_carterae.AAC.1
MCAAIDFVNPLTPTRLRLPKLVIHLCSKSFNHACLLRISQLSDEADPFEQTYRLMAIRKRAGPACVGGSLGRESGKPDAQIIELLSQ